MDDKEKPAGPATSKEGGEPGAGRRPVEPLGQRAAVARRASEPPSARPSQVPATRPSEPPGARSTGPDKDELLLARAELRAAEVEAEAARARSEVARLSAQTTSSRTALLRDQSDAARAQSEAAAEQVGAARAQSEAAAAQLEAAKVQAEAAVEQVSAARGQVESARAQAEAAERQAEAARAAAEAASAQLAIVKAQKEALEDMVLAAQRRTGAARFQAVMVALVAAAAGTAAAVGVMSFVRPEVGGSVDEHDARFVEAVEASAKILASRFEAEARAREEATAELAAKAGAAADRAADVADRVLDAGSSTGRIKVSSPALGEALDWDAEAVRAWLAEPEGAVPRTLRGRIQQAQKGATVTVDAHSDRWWPAGGPTEVGAGGAFELEVRLDPETLPTKLRVNLTEKGATLSREWAPAAAEP